MNEEYESRVMTRREHELYAKVLGELSWSLFYSIRSRNYTKAKYIKSYEYKAGKLILKLRSELDNIFYKDYPHKTSTYYGSGIITFT